MQARSLTIENGVAHPGDQVALNDGSIWELCYQEEAPDQLMICDKETYKNAQNEWGAGHWYLSRKGEESLVLNPKTLRK